MHLELRVLRYVCAVASEGGFQRAAARLHITQPSLSRQIGDLERLLGVRLFERRPTRLTPAGEDFVAAARRLVADADELVEQTRRAASARNVRLGYLSSAAYSCIPRLLEAVARDHPGVTLDAHEAWGPELESALREGRLDLAITQGIAYDDGLVGAVLEREPLVAVVSARHPLAGRSQARLHDLRDDTFCFFARHLAPGYHDSVTSAMRAAMGSFRIWEHPQPGLRLTPLRGEEGFTLVPQSVGAHLPRNLVALPLADKLPTADVAIVWRPASLSTAAADVLHTALGLTRAQAFGGPREVPRSLETAPAARAA